MFQLPCVRLIGREDTLAPDRDRAAKPCAARFHAKHHGPGELPAARVVCFHRWRLMRVKAASTFAPGPSAASSRRRIGSASAVWAPSALR